MKHNFNHKVLARLRSRVTQVGSDSAFAGSGTN